MSTPTNKISFNPSAATNAPVNVKALRQMVEASRKAKPEDLDPDASKCTCPANNYDVICKHCMPDRRLRFFDHWEKHLQGKQHLGPIRRFVKLSEPNSSSHRNTVRRMEAIRKELSAKTGHKLSKRDFRELMRSKMSDLHKQHLESLEKQ